MTSTFRPAAGGSYFRKTEDDEPVLVERTGAPSLDVQPIVIGVDLASPDEVGGVTIETTAPKGKRRGK